MTDYPNDGFNDIARMEAIRQRLKDGMPTRAKDMRYVLDQLERERTKGVRGLQSLAVEQNRNRIVGGPITGLAGWPI